ncbi:MAG: serine/threonine protein kinase [Sorangium cellulosum]|nr:MAG: serine/threonine protein kinase [Sorangium cellulosum]
MIDRDTKSPSKKKLQRPASDRGIPTPANGHLQPGSLFAKRYQIEELIGEGATGTVYAAQRVKDEQKVALKVIHPQLVGNWQINRRFHREALVLKKLTTPNIVRVHDFGEDESGLLFLDLEMLEGEQLGTILDNDAELPISQVEAIMLGICSALQQAHAAGIVHRDLKPDNVMVQRRDGKVTRVAVLDFGLSKMFHTENLGSTNLTEQNMVLGTPEYMAPEQARGDEVDARTDIYAAGVILYLMLTGRVPFKRRTPMAVMTAHLMEDPEEPASRASGTPVSSSMVAVAMHAIAKRPGDRYPDAASMADAFRKALKLPQSPSSVRPRNRPSDVSTDRDYAHADTIPVVTGLSEPPTSLKSSPVSLGQAKPRAKTFPWWMIMVIAGVAGVFVGLLVSLNC